MIILEEQNDRDSVWTPTRADFRRHVLGTPLWWLLCYDKAYPSLKPFALHRK